MDKAAGDENVKAVVFMVEGATIGTAQREEIRQAMARIKTGRQGNLRPRRFAAHG